MLTLYPFSESYIDRIRVEPYDGWFSALIKGDVAADGDSLSFTTYDSTKMVYSIDFENQSMKLTSVQWPEDSGHEANDYFLGLCDEKLYYKDASYIVSCGLDITAEEARTAYCPTCTFEGWTYGVFSKGITLTTDEYEFDYEKMEFVDPPMPEETEYQYHKISVGDTFGGLTVKSARTEIINTEDNSIGHNGVYSMSCELAFSGEITVDGYAFAWTNYGEEGAAPGDISFLFGAGEFDDIPMVIGWGYNAYPNVLPFAWRGSEFQYTSDTPRLFLGTPERDFPELDVSGIPSDGTPVPVRVTLTDIRLLASDGNGMRSYAKPVAITVLS